MASHHESILKLTQRLEEWDYKLDRLEHRLKDLPDEIKGQVRDKLNALTRHKEALREKEKSAIESAVKAANEIEASIEETLGAMASLFEEVELDVKVDVS